MNQADRKEFELIHEKIDNIKEDLKEMKHDMSMAHGKSEESLKFLKENLFLKIHPSPETYHYHQKNLFFF